MKRVWFSGALAAMLVLGLAACDPAGGGDTTTHPLYVANYGLDDGTDGLSAYSLETGGALAAIDSYSTGALALGGIAISPNGSYLYVTTNDSTLSAYSIGAGGVLTAITGTFTTGNSPMGITISPDSRYLYVTNSGLSGTAGLSAFSIGAGGVLSPITLTNLTSVSYPQGIAISPNGGFLYVANNNDTLSAYSIVADNGTLSEISGSPFAMTDEYPAGIAISPDGGSLYVAYTYNGMLPDVEDGLLAYTIGSDGALAAKDTPSYATGRSPRAIAISPDGGYLYLINQNSETLSAYSVGAAGALTAISGTFYTGSSPYAIAISPDGGYLYVANNTSTGMYGLTAYRVGAGGVPTATAVYSTGRNPRGIAICPVKK